MATIDYGSPEDSPVVPLVVPLRPSTSIDRPVLLPTQVSAHSISVQEAYGLLEKIAAHKRASVSKCRPAASYMASSVYPR